MYEEIIYAVDDPVATITLNRPETLNAWTQSIDAEIRDAIERAAADPAVVGIVITGAGRAFCSGADMSLLQSVLEDAEAAEGVELSVEEASFGSAGDFGGRFGYLMTTPKPIVAAINGPLAGMGFPFSLCCDLRVGTPDSMFMTAFAQRGLIAEWGLGWLLPTLVGPSVALDLLFSSRRVLGAEAKELGLLNHLVAPDELLPFCREYIENMAQTCAPQSLSIMKRQVYQHMNAGFGAAEFESQRLMRESFERPEFAEGVASFLEKRPPQFPRLGRTQP